MLFCCTARCGYREGRGKTEKLKSFPLRSTSFAGQGNAEIADGLCWLFTTENTKSTKTDRLVGSAGGTTEDAENAERVACTDDGEVG